MESQLAKDFHRILIDKLETRRHTLFASLALYMSKNDYISKANVDSYPINLAGKKAVQQFGSRLLEKLFKEEVKDVEEVDENEDSEEIQEVSDTNFNDTLRRALGKHWENDNQANKSIIDQSSIRKDFRTYDVHQQKSPLLEKLFIALCSAQPTSTQSERNFSLAAAFVSKQRTSLSDKHVDILCFLKSFFLMQCPDKSK